MSTQPSPTNPSTAKATEAEKQKMLSGELYNGFDPELLSERRRAKLLCYNLNQTPPDDTTKRSSIIHQLLNSSDAWIESPFHVDYGIHLSIGKGFYANHGVVILDCNQIKIGDNCLIGPGVCITAATHPVEVEKRAAGEEYTRPICIGDNVWLGANCTVCPGVTLGNGVVVGAGAVVTKSFPDNVVVGGVPARVIKTL